MVSIQCWKPNRTEFPQALVSSARLKEEAGRYFYPYWLLHLFASVKLPLIPERGGEIYIAVDAVTGQPMVTHPFETEDADAGEDEIIRPVVDPSGFDGDRFHQLIRATMNKRMKLLGDIAYEERSVRLVYKETLLWRSVFSEGGEMRLIALDTVTGEYGIVRMEDIAPR